MKYFLITLFVVCNVCYGEENKSSNGTEPIIINNTTESIPPPNTIAPANVTNPPNVTTTPPNVTTTPPNVTTTAPNVTISTSITTSKAPETTTDKPITTTKLTTPITSSKPNNITTTKPLPATTPAPGPNNRKFDGPSFVGGIVLACGLMAIGLIAFKFYKARTELNYHTL